MDKLRMVMVRGYYEEDDEPYIEYIPYSELKVGDNFIDIDDMTKILRKEDDEDILVRGINQEEDALNCL